MRAPPTVSTLNRFSGVQKDHRPDGDLPWRRVRRGGAGCQDSLPAKCEPAVFLDGALLLWFRGGLPVQDLPQKGRQIIRWSVAAWHSAVAWAPWRWGWRGRLHGAGQGAPRGVCKKRPDAGNDAGENKSSILFISMGPSPRDTSPLLARTPLGPRTRARNNPPQCEINIPSKYPFPLRPGIHSPTHPRHGPISISAGTKTRAGEAHGRVRAGGLPGVRTSTGAIASHALPAATSGRLGVELAVVAPWSELKTRTHLAQAKPRTACDVHPYSRSESNVHFWAQIRHPR